MDKLKENPFMAGIGGAVLLFLILAGVLIFPIWSDKGTLETKIKRKKMQLNSNTYEGSPPQVFVPKYLPQAPGNFQDNGDGKI